MTGAMAGGMTGGGVDLRSALGRGGDWRAATAACLAGLGDLPPGANLGFVYVTDVLAGELEAILEMLRAGTGIRDWAGSVGIGICGPAAEIFDEPAVSVVAGRLPPESYRLFAPVSAPDTASLDSFDREHGEWIAQVKPMLAVVHADPRMPAIIDTVSTFTEITSSFLVGGLSSARNAPAQVLCGVVSGGLSGVLLAPEVAVATSLSQGVSPIGPVRHITEADGGVVMTIDDRPALEVFKEDIGELLARDLRRLGGRVFAAFPVTGSDTADYVVRNLIAIDVAAGHIGIAAQFDVGDRIMFCRRDPESATRDMKRMLEGLKRRIGNETPKGGLYFSCLARGPNLFGPNAEELSLVRDTLGEFPIAGFFANGEISNDRLYAYTGVLMVFL